MYKKLTKSIEASMQIGNWFASGYRTMDELSKVNRITLIRNFVRNWVKGSNSILKNAAITLQKKGV